MVKGSFVRLKSKFRKLVLEISSSRKTWKADRQLVNIFLKAKWFLMNLSLFSIDTRWKMVAKTTFSQKENMI